MDDVPVSFGVSALADWPDAQLERVWRLSARAVRASFDMPADQLARLEAQAGATGAELMRRGRL